MRTVNIRNYDDDDDDDGGGGGGGGGNVGSETSSGTTVAFLQRVRIARNVDRCTS